MLRWRQLHRRHCPAQQRLSDDSPRLQAGGRGHRVLRERTCGQRPQASTPLPSARRVPTERCLCPRSIITFADAVSRSSSHPHSQECHRSSHVFLRMVWQLGHLCEVLDGSTKMTLRPAHAALTLTICVNVLHPASKMDLFHPAFAAAPLGTYFPFSSCLGAGAFVRGLVVLWQAGFLHAAKSGDGH
jgi:hypothetical protein